MGFLTVLVLPSPKVQAQDVGVLVEVSANVTVWPVVGAVGEKLKLTTGANTLTTTDLLMIPVPPVLVALMVTVNVPAVA